MTNKRKGNASSKRGEGIGPAPKGWKDEVRDDEGNRLYSGQGSVKYLAWKKLVRIYPNLTGEDREDCIAYCQYLERKDILEKKMDELVYSAEALEEEGRKKLFAIRPVLNKCIGEIVRYEEKLGLKRAVRRRSTENKTGPKPPQHRVEEVQDSGRKAPKPPMVVVK